MARRRTAAKTAVVDTNVILVANEKQPDVGTDCVLKCIDALQKLRDHGKLAVDEADKIFTEYLHRTKPWSSQKTGDAFVKWVHDNRYNPNCCDRVRLTPMPNDDQDFEEFPRAPALSTFERGDRVFVATALTHPGHPPILEACDTDYVEHRGALENAGLQIDFLCPRDICRLHERKHGGV